MFVADFIGRANFLDVTAAEVDGDRSRIEALGRSWQVPTHPDVRPGERARLLVRPESVRLQRSSASEVGGGIGRTLSSMFYGESIEYDVETEAGNIVVAIADPHEDETFAEGEFVEVAFEAARTYLLPLGSDPSS